MAALSEEEIIGADHF